MSDWLTEEQKTEFRAAFVQCQRESTKTIAAGDLERILLTMGHGVSRPQVHQMVLDVTQRSGDEVDWTQFLQVLALYLSSADLEQRELEASFALSDLSRCGAVTSANLMYVMSRMGCQLTPAEALEMIAEADTDGDGRLNFEEHRKVAARRLLHVPTSS